MMATTLAIMVIRKMRFPHPKMRFMIYKINMVVSKWVVSIILDVDIDIPNIFVDVFFYVDVDVDG